MSFLLDFLEYTDGKPSPEIFRIWSGISCVAGALERRVWIANQAGRVYPNLFVLLVAPPAIGKDMSIDPVTSLWRSTKGKIKVGSDSLTRASLLDEMENAKNILLLSPDKANGSGELLEYHALAVANPEFGNLVGEYDLYFLSLLTALYNCKETFDATTRTSKSVFLKNVCLNILCGWQPATMAHIVPEAAWGQGFMARMLMVYAASMPKVDLWGDEDYFTRPHLKKKLEDYILKMTDLYGRYSVQPEAIEYFREWEKTNFAPVPKHPRLIHYLPRRGLFLRKLCMISAASSRLELIITLKDMEIAKAWLLSAESSMAEVFKDMAGKSDSIVLDEFHQEVWSFYGASGNQPVQHGYLCRLLKDKVTVDRYPRIIEAAKNLGMIEYLGEGMYRPKAPDSWIRK